MAPLSVALPAQDFCSLQPKSTPGCEWLPDYIRLASFDDEAEAREMLLLYSTLCRGAHLPGSTVYYPNGRTATSYAGQQGVTWYYSNGNAALPNQGRLRRAVGTGPFSRRR